jgi:acyl-CoA thioesterase-1
MVIFNLKHFSKYGWVKLLIGYGVSLLTFNIVAFFVCLFLSLKVNATEPIKIVMLGDSLTAGYGLPMGQSVPEQLELALKTDGINVKIINAGVSGDTSAGGLARLTWALEEKPKGLIIELGANDGLRGLDPKQTYLNLKTIIEQAISAQIEVLLTGMLAPPNLGPEYSKDFNRIFPLLARKQGVEFYPFYLEGVISNPTLNLKDGLHPNEKGIAIIVKNLLPKVKKLITKIKKI